MAKYIDLKNRQPIFICPFVNYIQIPVFIIYKLWTNNLEFVQNCCSFIAVFLYPASQKEEKFILGVLLGLKKESTLDFTFSLCGSSCKFCFSHLSISFPTYFLTFPTVLETSRSR